MSSGWDSPLSKETQPKNVENLCNFNHFYLTKITQKIFKLSLSTNNQMRPGQYFPPEMSYHSKCLLLIAFLSSKVHTNGIWPSGWPQVQKWQSTLKMKTLVTVFVKYTFFSLLMFYNLLVTLIYKKNLLIFLLYRTFSSQQVRTE